MKKFAQILNGRAHWVFEALEKPDLAEDIVLVEITALTVQPKEGWSYTGGLFVAPAQPTSAEIKELKWVAIKAERDRRKAGGFKVGSNWYHSDESSRGQYGTLLSMAVEKALPVATALSPAWKDMAGNFAPMTVSLLRQIRDAGLVVEQQLFTAAETHKAAMMASADPASYDFSTGWPAAYTA